MAQRLSRNLQRESQDLMSNFVDDTKADAVVHGFDDPSTTNSDVDVRNESLHDATLADDDWNSFVMMGDVTDYSDDDSSSESSMPSRAPTPPPATLSLEDAMSDWIAEFLWEMCTSGLGNPKYTFSAQPPAALSPQIKTILARIPFRASPCSLYLALWYTSRLPVSFHLPHFAFPPGSPQYDFYMDFIGLSKNSNTSLPEGPEAAPYRLFCLGLFFAYKWLEEYDMKSSVWCDIFKLPPRVLNSLEMNALRIFEHTLAIDELEWMRWLLELQCDRPAFPSISRIRPSDVDAARRVSLDWLLDHTCLPISNEGSGAWFHPSSGSRSSSPSAYSNSPSPSTSDSVPVPEAYFIGKSERILTKRLMLERELAQLGMTEEEYDAEEDHTPICSVEESLRRVLDSAEAYRAAEDARLAKAARKEAERLRIEGEKERIRQERERMERERVERQKRREEAKREEARKAEEAARKAREQAAEEEAKAKRIALAAQAEAEVLAKAIEDNKAKKNAWRSQYKWDVAPSRPLPPVPTTNAPAATKRSSPTNSLKRPSPSRSSPPTSRPYRRGSFSSDSSSTSSTSSFSSKPTSSSVSSGSSSLFIKVPSSSSTYAKAPVQSAPATTTGFGAPTFSSTAKSVNNGGSSSFHRNFSSSAYQRHAQAQKAANMFGTVFVPLKRSGSHGSAGINVGSNSSSWRKEKREEENGWMEMV